jgi:AcrR family transcriptional regulator
VASGRRERAKQHKRERIMAAASELFALQGVSGVTTQQVADRADIAIGTLYLYASTKAELLIMVQNEKFSSAIDDGLAASAAGASPEKTPLDSITSLIGPVVKCLREHVENGRTYLHELVFGDPTEPYRHDALILAGRLARDHRDHPSEHHRHRLPAAQRPRGARRHPRAGPRRPHTATRQRMTGLSRAGRHPAMPARCGCPVRAVRRRGAGR